MGTTSPSPEGLRVPYGELRVCEDIPGAFAELVRETLRPAAEPRTIALSGGSTARECYERLAGDDGVAWPAITVLIGDERCVPAEHPDANQAMIREVLGERLQQLAGFHPMDCSDVEGYDRLVAERTPIDLVHLGLGPDGHTASLFPQSAGLDSPAGVLVLRNTDPKANNPHPRLTLSFEAIAKSSLAVFTVSGASKQDALHRILSGEDLPAARVRSKQVIWLCDPEALGPDLELLEGAG